MRAAQWLSIACAVLLLGGTPAHAQSSGGNSSSGGECAVQSLDTSASTPADPAASDTTTPTVKQARVTNPRPAVAVEPTTEAERIVQRQIRKDGIHVVHFWAPWCPNSKNELANGWDELVADNPEVSFTFVTVWNDGERGNSVLERYDLPDRVQELTQPDLGPSDTEANRRQSFLSHPVTWIPSTWIFHNNGELAFAMNYGEMEMQTIQSLLDATRQDW